MVTGLSGRLLRNCFTWSARRVDWTVTIRLSGSGLIASGATCARLGDPCWRPRIHFITRTYSFIGEREIAERDSRILSLEAEAARRTSTEVDRGWMRKSRSATGGLKCRAMQVAKNR